MPNTNTSVDLSKYAHSFSIKNKLGRIAWNMCYRLFFRPFGGGLFKKWRRFLLRLFGATIGKNSHVYSSVRIWAPWNLIMGDYSTLGPEVDCYNQGEIRIGSHTIVSQKAYLCASTHAYEQADFDLLCQPVHIGNQVWIAADAFIGPGVKLSDGAVVGARSAVFRSVDPWTVVGGNPAKPIKIRNIS